MSENSRGLKNKKERRENPPPRCIRNVHWWSVWCRWNAWKKKEEELEPILCIGGVVLLGICSKNNEERTHLLDDYVGSVMVKCGAFRML
jgi:hypothetical protein